MVFLLAYTVTKTDRKYRTDRRSTPVTTLAIAVFSLRQQ